MRDVKCTYCGVTHKAFVCLDCEGYETGYYQTAYQHAYNKNHRVRIMDTGHIMRSGSPDPSVRAAMVVSA